MQLSLSLQREPTVAGRTFGHLFVDGAYQCLTLEDAVRPYPEKVPGETAIWPGTYEVRVTESARFHCLTPEVLEVPLFAGVRLHPGNTIADTHGCILLGCGRAYDALLSSRMAFLLLMERLQHPCVERIILTVINGDM